MNLLLIGAIIGILLGIALGYLIRKNLAQRVATSAEGKVEQLLKDAKNKQQEILLQAKEKALKIIEEAKHEESLRKKEADDIRKRLEQRETLFDQKILELQDKQSKLIEKEKQLELTTSKVNNLYKEAEKKIEKIADLSKEEAKNELIHLAEKEYKEELTHCLHKLEKENTEILEKKAREILLSVIERIASSVASEVTTTTVQLPSDELKGRVIGREGRNIKVIEHLTGCEIIVDETPGIIMVSGFSPIRRQMAKRALEKLVSDGRIHPARIEEMINESKRELDTEIKKAGEDALYELGITGIHPKLVQILGRLKFRTSFGQNVLSHSIEVARIATMLAELLGADVTISKKGGLFHDIGKAVDHDVQGGHPEIGKNILKRFNLPEEIANISVAHHEDKPSTLEAVIVKTADAISGARPGARKDTLEAYLQRLEELEKIATSFPGVEKAYAIQAGREIRVFVKPESIDDYRSTLLAKEIARKIESDLAYPGEIKVTVIRELRCVEYAK